MLQNIEHSDHVKALGEWQVGDCPGGNRKTPLARLVRRIGGDLDAANLKAKLSCYRDKKSRGSSYIKQRRTFWRQRFYEAQILLKCRHHRFFVAIVVHISKAVRRARKIVLCVEPDRIGYGVHKREPACRAGVYIAVVFAHKKPRGRRA